MRLVLEKKVFFIGVLVFDTKCFLDSNVSIVMVLILWYFFFRFEFYLNKFSCFFNLSFDLLNSKFLFASCLSVFLKQCQHFIVNNMFMDLANIGNFATYNSHMCCLKMWGPKDDVYKLIWQIIWASSEHSYVERICIWYTCAKVTHIHFTHICEHSNRNVCFCK